MNNRLGFSIVKHVYAIFGICLLGAGTFSYYVDMRPFVTDDLYALAFGTLRTPLSFITESWVQWVPGYRPLSSLTFWLQYQLVGIEPISYYVFNISVLLGCAIALYFLVYLITKSRLSSFFSAILFLVDFRVSTSLFWIIERQNPLAVFFGVSGIALCFYAIEVNKMKASAIWIYLLLVLSTLSKEFGLAFVGCLVVLALLLHQKYWKIILIIVVSVSLTYFGLRFGLAKSNQTLDYCEEEIGFKDNTISLCYNDYEPKIRINFYIWNIGASLVGTVIPDLFSNVGQWVGINYSPGFLVLWGTDVSTTEIVFGLAIVMLVGISLIKSPKESFSLLSLVIFNSILSFLLFRGRNQLVGMIGLYGMVGIGLNYLKIHYLQLNKLGFLLIGLTLILSTTILIKATSLSHYLDTIAASYSNSDPCESVISFPHPEAFDMEIIKELKIKYKMSNPECLQDGWKTWRLKSQEISK